MGLKSSWIPVANLLSRSESPVSSIVLMLEIAVLIMMPNLPSRSAAACSTESCSRSSIS